jgi:hypothetical protein
MDGIPRATNAGDVCAISRPMLSAARAALTCSGSFLGNVRVMMGVVYAVVWACSPPVEWTGMPPVGWTGRCLPAEWTSLIKCGGGTSPASGMDRHTACGMDRSH